MRILVVGSCLTILAACSVVNAPADPEDPLAQSGSGATGPGPGGAAPGGGGEGGQGGDLPGTCGDGVVDPGEDCDDEGESATCNADCTSASCGDGVLNVTAGEECDDGDTDGGDACSASCEVTPFAIDPAGPAQALGGINMQPAVAVAPIDGVDHFVVAYVQYADPGDFEVRVAVFDAQGNPVGTPLSLSNTTGAVGPSIAANTDGRLVVAWRDDAGANATVRYAILNPGVTPGAFVDVILPDTLGFKGLPRVASSPSNDGFCVQWLATVGQIDQIRVRCLDASGMVGSTSTQTFGTATTGFASGIYSAHGIFPAGSGYMSQYNNAGEVMGQALTTIGQPQGNAFTIAPAGPSGNDAIVENGVAGSGGGFISGFSLRGVFGQAVNQRYRVHVRRFSAPGQPAGPAVIASAVDGEEYGGWIVGQGGEAFVLFPSAVGTIGSECLLKAQPIAADGTVTGTAIDVSAPAVEQCGVFAEAAVNAAGDVFITWVQLDQAQSATVAARTHAALYPRLLPAK